MRIKIYILLFIIFVFVYDVDAQRIKGEVIAGFNLSQVDGDHIYGFNKFGANVGAGAIFPISKSFSFTIETLYNQKGSYQGKQKENTDSLGNEITGEYNLKLNYLEIPILFQYNDKDIITAGLGFSYGRLVSVKEYEQGRLVETTTLNDGPYDRDDFNIIADFYFRIHKKIPRFKFNIRYAYSLAKIRTRDFYYTNGEYQDTRDQYNNVITLRFIYIFNEKAKLADSK